MTRLCGPWKRSSYKSFEKVLPFIAALIDCVTKQEVIVLIMRVDTGSNLFVANLTGYKSHWAWNGTVMVSLGRRVKAFKRMLVETFDGRRNAPLYNVVYCSLENIVNDIHKIETLSVFDCLNEHFNVRTKRLLGRRLQRGRR